MKRIWLFLIVFIVHWNTADGRRHVSSNHFSSYEEAYSFALYISNESGVTNVILEEAHI